MAIDIECRRRLRGPNGAETEYDLLPVGKVDKDGNLHNEGDASGNAKTRSPGTIMCPTQPGVSISLLSRVLPDSVRSVRSTCKNPTMFASDLRFLEEMYKSIMR